MPDASLPTTPLLWLAALVPLAAILLLLIGLRWKAASAAPVGYFLTAGIALTVFQAPLALVALQSVKGVWDALFIAYVIAPALLLYQISKEAGAFGAIRRGIESVTPNTLLQVLAFGWVLPTFLQGITGFGAPVAVAAPLLVAVGVRPIWAVVIPVIGHAWAKSFGTLAVAWEGLTLVTDPANPGFTALVAGVMLSVVNLLAGIAIAWFVGRGQGVREGLPAIGLIAAIHGVGHSALAPVLPELAVVVPATVAVAAVLVLARTVYAGPSGVRESQVIDDPASDKRPARAGAGNVGPRSAAASGSRAEQPRSTESGVQPRRTESGRQPRQAGAAMPLWLAFSPYLVLIVLITAVQLIPPVRETLASVQLGLPFPAMETGYGVTTEAVDAYSAFSPLVHPGTFLLVSSVIAFVLYRTRGHIGGGRIDEVATGTLKTSIPSVMALLALIPLAQVLQGSGMVVELAAGISAVATGPVYAFLAPVIGLVGGFLTGSNLSSNILFGPLQERAADALEITRPFVLAGQTAGAAIGGAIAVSTVLLGIGAVGEPGRSAAVIRRALPWTGIALVVLGVISLSGTLLLDANGSGADGSGADGTTGTEVRP